MSEIGNKLKRIGFVDRFVRPLYRAAVYPSRRSAALRYLSDMPATKQGKTVWYCGTPIHANLGDIAQKLCILDWIAEFFPGYDVVRMPGICFEYAGKEAIEWISRSITEDDVFLFQSGYTMSDRHGDESFHRLIPETFRKHPILVMPQTIKYRDSDNMKRTASALACNERVVLLARDGVSYQTAREHFSKTYSSQFPDIVTTLIGDSRRKGADKSGVIFCLRDDSEKLHSQASLSQLVDRYRSRVPVKVIDTTKADLDPNAADSVLWDAVDNQIDEFARCQVTVTDRFHGMILSLAAGTPAIVLSTNDHKVTSGADWFQGNDVLYVKKADSLEAAVPLIDACLSDGIETLPDDSFRQMFYQTLPDLLEKKGFPITTS